MDNNVVYNNITGCIFLSFCIQRYSESCTCQNTQNQNYSLGEINTIGHIPAQRVRGGEIDIAYKQLGNNSDKPIVLVNGLATTMDMWGPTLLKELSSNHKVIIFDNLGIDQSTVGTKDFLINQFANDTIGLLDALKIGRADILGIYCPRD